jgi:hypothetical protein
VTEIRKKIYQLIDMTYYATERRQCKKLASQYELPGGYKRIYHYHIRKTGGTSLNQSMFAYCGADPAKTFTAIAKKFNSRLILNGKVVVRDNRYLFEQGNYFYGFSHNPAYELRLPEKTFTFSIFRDPYKRLLSHYKMLLHIAKKEQKPDFFLKYESHWLGNGFSDFIERVPDEHLMRQLYMFSKKFDAQEAKNFIDANLNFYFFTDNYNDGMSKLCSVLGINLKVLHRRSTQGMNIELDKREQLRAMERLEPEYEFLRMLRDNGSGKIMSFPAF